MLYKHKIWKQTCNVKHSIKQYRKRMHKQNIEVHSCNNLLCKSNKCHIFQVQDTIINVLRSSCKVPLSLSHCNETWNFLKFFNNSEIQNFMKIHSMSWVLPRRQRDKRTNRLDNAFCNFAYAPTPWKQVRSPAREQVEREDSVGGILVMWYEKVPIVRRDLKDTISRYQTVCYIDLNWEHHQGYETISGETGCITNSLTVNGKMSYWPALKHGFKAKTFFIHK